MGSYLTLAANIILLHVIRVETGTQWRRTYSVNIVNPQAPQCFEKFAQKTYKNV